MWLIRKIRTKLVIWHRSICAASISTVVDLLRHNNHTSFCIFVADLTSHSFLSILLLVFLFVTTLSMGPRKVFILRHAEKPEDKSNIHLSPIGIERARKLVVYFQANAHLFGNVGAIYACAPYKEDSSTRAEETMQFLADHLHIEIITKYTREKKSDEGRRDVEGHRAPVKSSQSDMAEKILSKSKYNGKTVIICWEHKTIPDLIVSLGGPDIDDWGKVYDRIVELKYSEEGQVIEKIEHRMSF